MQEFDEQTSDLPSGMCRNFFCNLQFHLLFFRKILVHCLLNVSVHKALMEVWSEVVERGMELEQGQWVSHTFVSQ